MNKSHEVKFKTNARTVNLLGRDNILDFKSAIIELLKNSYDAYSERVDLIFDDNKLIIADVGEGMTVDAIKDVFFTLGTDNKLNNKSISNTSKKRIMNGSMGIGRLSLGRLGDTCTIITSDGVSAHKFSIDWNSFSDGTNLDNLTFNIYEISIENFRNEYLKIGLLPKNNKGTIIIATDLKDAWEEKDFVKPDSNFSILKKSLERLQSPTKTLDQFSINLRYFKQEKITIDTSIDDLQYDAKIKFEYFPTGKIKLEGTFDEFDINKMPTGFLNMYEKELAQYTSKDKHDNAVYSFSKEINLGEKYPLETIGTFQGIIYFVKKTRGGGPPFVTLVGDRASKEAIEKGISLYRDEFKIRPYGEENSVGFDWIGIETRRSTNPAAVTRKDYLMQANQLSGFVNITREKNSEFHDQANREGLKNSPEFNALKNIMLDIITEFSKVRSEVHIWYKSYLSTTSDTQHHSEKGIVKKKKIDTLLKKHNGSTHALFTDPEFSKMVDKETLFELYSLTDVTQETNNDLIDESDMLRALATQGIVMGSFAHQIKNEQAFFKESPKTLNRFADFYEKEFSFKMEDLPKNNLRDFSNVLQKKNINILSFINSALRNPRRGKRSKINILEYFESTFNWWIASTQDTYNDYKYTINNQDISKLYDVSVKKAYILSNWQQLDNIFTNLIVNSHANFFEHNIRTRHINIDITCNDENVVFEYSDSGNGLSNKISTSKEIIFEPYVSYSKFSKSTGIGMWILKSTVKSLKGDVKIMSEIGEPNFRIKITIPGGLTYE